MIINEKKCKKIDRWGFTNLATDIVSLDLNVCYTIKVILYDA